MCGVTPSWLDFRSQNSVAAQHDIPGTRERGAMVHGNAEKREYVAAGKRDAFCRVST
jgi:hypothetical protein